MYYFKQAPEQSRTLVDDTRQKTNNVKSQDFWFLVEKGFRHLVINKCGQIFEPPPPPWVPAFLWDHRRVTDAATLRYLMNDVSALFSAKLITPVSKLVHNWKKVKSDSSSKTSKQMKSSMA